MQIRLRYATVACSIALSCFSGLAASPSVLALAAPVSGKAAHMYHGAWFDIACPAGFRVKSGPLSTSSTTGSDSAYFTSPDGAAQFFVFSPQWSGDCPYAQIDTTRETLVSTRQQVTPSKFKGATAANALHITWTTVRSQSGDYMRSWEDYQDGSTNTRHVFGIRYNNAQALTRYKAQYAAFKKSLKQFAD